MVELIDDINLLRERCDEINVFENKDEIKEASDKIIEYLNSNPDVFALSASQVGHNLRMFAIRFEDGIKFFVNAMFTKQTGLHVSIETNPQFKGRNFLITRNDSISLAYQDLIGLAGEAEFDGTAGDLIQQMVYLTDGLLLDELGLEVFDDFINASTDEQNEVIDYYLNTLKSRSNDLNEEIENNPELKEYKEGMDFLLAAAKGDVEVEFPSKLSKRKQRKIDKLKKRIRNFGKRFTKKKKKK